MNKSTNNNNNDKNKINRKEKRNIDLKMYKDDNRSNNIEDILALLKNEKKK